MGKSAEWEKGRVGKRSNGAKGRMGNVMLQLRLKLVSELGRPIENWIQSWRATACVEEASQRQVHSKLTTEGLGRRDVQKTTGPKVGDQRWCPKNLIRKTRIKTSKRSSEFRKTYKSN